jgi:hypothetical protein
VYIREKIPEEKARNALASCKIPWGERLLVLINCTVFGSAKNCLLFTPLAIYAHNDWTGKSPTDGGVDRRRGQA